MENYDDSKQLSDLKERELKYAVSELGSFEILETKDGRQLIIPKDLGDYLKNVKELRDDGFSIREAIKIAKNISRSKSYENSIENKDSDGDEDEIKKLREKLKRIKKENRFLREEIDQEDRRVKKLLPEHGKGFGVFDRFKKLLRGC